MANHRQWAVKWVSKNRVDGYQTHLMPTPLYDPAHAGLPAVFRSRREARAWRDKNFGYIAKREDLRKEPHGWKVPRVVRVVVIVREL